MSAARSLTDSLTPTQRRAVEARGNVLVMAGAGTGKTKTLVERCLDCLEHDGAAMDELLIVTFTEAAAAEMRDRLRHAIEDKVAQVSTPCGRPSFGSPISKSAARCQPERPAGLETCDTADLEVCGTGEGAQAQTLDPRPSTLNPQPSTSFWSEQLARFDLAHIGTLHSFCLKLVREHFYELGLDPRLTLLDEGQARQLANETMDEQFAAHYGELFVHRFVGELAGLALVEQGQAATSS